MQRVVAWAAAVITANVVLGFAQTVAVAAERAAHFSPSVPFLAKTKDFELSGHLTKEGEVRQASAEVVVPTLACDQETRALLLGIFGVNTGTDVFVACDGGVPLYRLDVYAGQEADFDQSFNVQAGDSLKISVSQSANRILAKLVNVTRGETITAEGTPPPETLLLFGTLRAFRGGPPNFGQVAISTIKLNKATFTKPGDKLDRVDAGKVTLKTGKLAQGAFVTTVKVH